MIHFYQFVLIASAFFHPFHVSVCSVHYASAEKSLQITMKIFADDLEAVLNEKPYHQDGQAYLDILHPENPDALNVLVEQYIRKHFSITVNGEAVKPVYLGYEMEDLAMWCYWEVGDVKKVKNIKVKNAILTEAFSDQVNIVHVNYKDAIKSMKLAGNNLVGEVEFE